MERSRLSIRALVVLASELGAEHLFGVRDPFMTVSYTHLDVYKRQAHALPQLPARASGASAPAVRQEPLRRPEAAPVHLSLIHI